MQTNASSAITGSGSQSFRQAAPWLRSKSREAILGEIHGAVAERGLSREFAAELTAPAWRAYFVNREKLMFIASRYPSLLLFPWERMRAMGILELRHPVYTEYTFFSHQWQTPGHPWPDLLQLTEQLDSVQTPYIWFDWFCVPQWSRTSDEPDPIAIQIFLVTMRSFHKLCFCSSAAMLVFKRDALGLTMRGWDKNGGRNYGMELREHIDAIRSAVESPMESLEAAIQAEETHLIAIGEMAKNERVTNRAGAKKRAEKNTAFRKEIQRQQWFLTKNDRDTMAFYVNELARLLSEIEANGVDLEYAIRAW